MKRFSQFKTDEIRNGISMEECNLTPTCVESCLVNKNRHNWKQQTPVVEYLSWPPSPIPKYPSWMANYMTFKKKKTSLQIQLNSQAFKVDFTSPLRISRQKFSNPSSSSLAKFFCMCSTHVAIFYEDCMKGCLQHIRLTRLLFVDVDFLLALILSLF